MSDRERSEMPDAKTRASSAGIVLVTLAAGQFLMTLDSSVMNVSIATVAKDVGTSVTGIQTAITFYTLVMASLMITGGKVGEILGRKRAFAIGCGIYACGSLTTSLAPNLTVLMIGWSFLEGVGAVLIMPAIVALGVRRGGRHRAGDPRSDPAHERDAGRGGGPARSGRHGALRGRTCIDRPGNPPRGYVGFRAAQTGGP